MWFKGVGEALAAARAMQRAAPRDASSPPSRTRRPRRRPTACVGPLSQREMAELYADTDVVLKLSRVEGMFGPPLEGFHWARRASSRR